MLCRQAPDTASPVPGSLSIELFASIWLLLLTGSPGLCNAGSLPSITCSSTGGALEGRGLSVQLLQCWQLPQFLAPAMTDGQQLPPAHLLGNAALKRYLFIKFSPAPYRADFWQVSEVVFSASAAGVAAQWPLCHPVSCDHTLYNSVRSSVLGKPPLGSPAQPWYVSCNSVYSRILCISHRSITLYSNLPL